MRRSRKRSCLALAFAFAFPCAAPIGHAAAPDERATLRKIAVGSVLGPFELADGTGARASYGPAAGRVLVLMILSAPQRQTERLIGELSALVTQLRRDGHGLDLIAAVSNEEGRRYIEGRQKEWGLDFPVRIDPEYHLWGSLGVIATPTIILVDTKGVVSWIYAGYGHDFGEAFRSEVSQALGLIPRKTPRPGEGKDLVDPSVEDRARRHVKVAALLAEKGHEESAVAEIKKATALVPTSAEFQIELAHILCQAGKAEEALSALARIDTAKPYEKARVSMVAGWSHRQLGNDALAEKLLKEATDGDVPSVRALYELGKVYEGRGDKDRAMELYHRALATQFREAFPAPALKPGGQKPASSPR